MNHKRMFFDIETVANPENIKHMPEPEAPANFKDPEKIAAAIEAKRIEQIERAALDPDYGKILSIGISLDGDRVDLLINGDVSFPPQGETEQPAVYVSEVFLLEEFWKVFSSCGGNCVGYNILGFDLPYLLRRSFALGVKVPLVPNLAKFRTEPVTDLMMVLYNWGSDRYKGIKQVAKLYGLPIEAPDIDGSMVAKLSLIDLAKYQVSDVRLVIALYERMNGIYFIH